MDIKSWLESGTHLKWKELRYLKTPKLPYFIFIDDIYTRGADSLNNIIEHNLTLEHYSEVVDEENEKIIKDFLDKEDLNYEKNREWLSEEEMWITIFNVDTFLEKRRRNKNEKI